jgi:hypothetical protein
MECLVFYVLTYFVIRIRVLAFPIRAFFKFRSYSIRTFTLLIDLAMRYVPLFKPVLVGRALTVVFVIAEERMKEDSASTKWRCRCASWLNSKLLYPCSCWYRSFRSSRYHSEFLFSFYLHLFSHFYILFTVPWNLCFLKHKKLYCRRFCVTYRAKPVLMYELPHTTWPCLGSSVWPLSSMRTKYFPYITALLYSME